MNNDKMCKQRNSLYFYAGMWFGSTLMGLLIYGVFNYDLGILEEPLSLLIPIIPLVGFACLVGTATYMVQLERNS